MLRGFVHLPYGEERSRHWVIVAPGFPDTSFGVHQLYVRAAQQLCKRGFGVLRFDYALDGDSVTRGNKRDEVADLIAAHQYISHSWAASWVGCVALCGGCMASIKCCLDSGLRLSALVMWSPEAGSTRGQSSPLGVFRRLISRRTYLVVRGMMLHPGPVVSEIFTRILEARSSQRTERRLHRAKRPIGLHALPRRILAIHGEGDPGGPSGYAYYAGVLGSLGIYVSHSVIRNADHTFRSVSARDTLLAQTCTWLLEERRRHTRATADCGGGP